jgi:hypothetical protein
LDAGSVAELYGLTVSELAHRIEADEKAALFSPDSNLVHEKLLPFDKTGFGDG